MPKRNISEIRNEAQAGLERATRLHQRADALHAEADKVHHNAIDLHKPITAMREQAASTRETAQSTSRKNALKKSAKTSSLTRTK